MDNRVASRRPSWRWSCVIVLAVLAGCSDGNSGGGTPSSGWKRQDQAVGGHFRSNGTYVAPHYRTPRNDTQRDNYSSYPNVNPYTGRKGYVRPRY